MSYGICTYIICGLAEILRVSMLNERKEGSLVCP